MNNDDMARRKFDMLMQAVEQVNKQDEAMEELRDAAFEVLLLHPGIDRDEWKHIIVKHYCTEVIDAYGYCTEPIDMVRNLEKLWLMPYLDENSGLERSYEEWAQAYATEAAVQMYYDLITPT